MIRTLGVDLAGQDKRTVSCEVEWTVSQAVVLPPKGGRPLAEIADDMRRVNWTGIDAPFGWPDAFVDGLRAARAGEPWPPAAAAQLRHRVTDVAVHDRVLDERGVSLWPLSVSSDRIAVCAWRCAELLSRYQQHTGQQIDRIGTPHVGGPDGVTAAAGPGQLVGRRGIVEVYPAGALAMWELPFKGYKPRSKATAPAAAAMREQILDTLCERAASWLLVEDHARAACLATDDALDALLSALVAYAAASGVTYGPAVDQRGAAQREGWIHLPHSDRLASLALAAPDRAAERVDRWP